MDVFVVTGLDLGWDCIVGVFDAKKVTKEQLRERFPETDAVIFEYTVDTNLKGY